MPDIRKTTSGGSAGGDFLKGICACLLIAAAVAFVKWFIGIVLWIWGLVKLGFITAGRVAVILVALMAPCFVIALLCDALAPLFRRIRKSREKRRAMARCRLPSLSAFRTGKSEMEDEVAQVDRFLSTLLRERYLQLTGYLPDRNTFRNNESSYTSFKAGELPRAILTVQTQVEQDLFSPLIAAYRMSDGKEPVKEE